MSPGDGPEAGERPPLVAEGVPRHDGAGAAGAQAGRRLVHALGRRGVAHREGLVGDGDQPVEQQPGDDQLGEADDQAPAHGGRGTRADPPPQQPCGRPVGASKAAAGEDEQAEDRGGDQGETTTRAML